LTLVRRLAEMHDGCAAAASEGPGRGSSFAVRLPRLPVPPPRVGGSAASSAADRQRILVVEDNADGREMLRMMLALQGHDVDEAGDGESAIRKALELRPCVAIIDIGLPGIDGYEVAARMRAADAGLADMQLIALTGYGTEQDRRRAEEAGFDAHLTKPVVPEKLAHLLARRRPVR
jgi:CheY-like chemotaxis protein